MHTKSVSRPWRGKGEGACAKEGEREPETEGGRQTQLTPAHTSLCEIFLKKYFFYIQQNQHIFVQFLIPSPLTLKKKTKHAPSKELRSHLGVEVGGDGAVYGACLVRERGGWSSLIQQLYGVLF